MAFSLSPDLIVSDLERSVRFYSRALGLTETDRVAGPDGAFFAMLEHDGLRIMLETSKSPDPTTRGLMECQGPEPRATVNFWTLVDNVGAERRRLEAADVAFHGPVEKPYGYREISFRDPDGYQWTLAERVETAR